MQGVAQALTGAIRGKRLNEHETHRTCHVLGKLLFMSQNAALIDEAERAGAVEAMVELFQNSGDLDVRTEALYVLDVMAFQ
eukprot:CAMPEP_0170146240 /NCGR_PEP_ID=MMETSP0033_2-20121228/29129_1 /TAXON_ID=195969 /ORGANISM="Dolichomastix tenuilepis, Strain CCMP3274" /LENGTH=80 /DNA_ID=CAMNT_0010382945 /DNA_START=304 /DNA_END=543 /DNA_ORIENTATION=+